MKPIFAAYFDQGQVPWIDCVFLNKTPLGKYAPQQLVDALQKFLNEHFVPVWGAPARLSLQPQVNPNNWGLIFVDTPDIADALGYHDLTKDGLPLSKVFVQTTKQNGEEVSVTASHEIVEMLIDPGIQMIAQDFRTGRLYAYEVADAVERETFKVDGIPMTNFQYPAWFESFRKPGYKKFDHLGTCRRPFQINRGGYMSYYDGKRWRQVFASKIDEKKFHLKQHPRALNRKQKYSSDIKLKKSRT